MGASAGAATVYSQDARSGVNAFGNIDEFTSPQCRVASAAVFNQLAAHQTGRQVLPEKEAMEGICAIRKLRTRAVVLQHGVPHEDDGNLVRRWHQD